MFLYLHTPIWILAFTYRLIVVDGATRFLNFIIPYADGILASGLSVQILTCILIKGEFVISIGQLTGPSPFIRMEILPIEIHSMTDIL